MPKTSKPPSYRRHKATGQAVVTLAGRDYYLGKHATKASRAEYDRLVAEWLANGRRMPQESGAVASVSELMAAYLCFATGYFRKDGKPTREIGHIKHMMSGMRSQYGRRLVTEFGPLALKTVREQLVALELSRTYVNDTIARVKRMFKWGVENELVPPSVHHGLQAVAGLKRGRCKVRETEPVRPVPDEYVDAIRPHLSRHVWTMVELQRLTGMRSGEVITMRGRDLDTIGRIWLYRPQFHKTEHHGHGRIVELGPRAQRVIRPFLKPDTDAYLFSPRDVVAEKNFEKRQDRKSKVQPSQRDRSKTNPKRGAGERYTPDSYRQAVQRACDAADAQARADLVEAGETPGDERVIPSWHPHQLRHNFGTAVRKHHGIEIARILLGHRSAVVTELYAEVDRTKARKVVAKIG